MVISVFYPSTMVILPVLCAFAVGVLASFLFFRGRGGQKPAKSADDMKPGPEKDIVIGIRDNAAEFADLFEPLYLLAEGNVSRKDAVFEAWNTKVASSFGSLEFKSAFAAQFGYVEKWKGKKKKYIKNAQKLLKYIKKAGIERNKDIAVSGNETTAEKYVLAGNASLEEGASYDVLAHYWYREDEILSKGVIR
ncbi:MAG: hypothetical protein IJK89_02035 [Clostridia bacterium]|nr:hypothetical protein [Clostridia bacterium]